MRKHEDEFYGNSDEEVLTETTLDDAIEMIIDGMVGQIPQKIKVYKYKREKVKNFIKVDDVLESIVERIDERYGDMDGEPTPVSPEMATLTSEYISKIEQMYVPWTCEIVEEMEVDTKKWITENAPHWLESIEFRPYMTGQETTKAINKMDKKL